ncbi:hypothetical protein GLYMA_01G100801v4 [Glycine max]|nr:hypothetical protein GLYMA_01G100801v4 [Glycine max]KAH1162453.1 hypothetical protein GYH30_001084 [Glycine max]
MGNCPRCLTITKISACNGSMCLVGLLVEDGWLKTHQVL